MSEGKPQSQADPSTSEAPGPEVGGDSPPETGSVGQAEDQQVDGTDRVESLPDDPGSTEEPTGAGEPPFSAEDPAEEEVSREVPVSFVNPLVEALRSELAAKDEQLRTYIAAYKEANADMERERQRMERQRDQVADRDRMALAGGLLDVMDNIDRSLSSCNAGVAIEDVGQGLGLVRRQFLEALDGLGVERMDCLGKTFNATLHEATGMIPATGDQADQEIIFEERPGYGYRGKLLRAARVVVAFRGA